MTGKRNASARAEGRPAGVRRHARDDEAVEFRFGRTRSPEAVWGELHRDEGVAADEPNNDLGVMELPVAHGKTWNGRHRRHLRAVVME